MRIQATAKVFYPETGWCNWGELIDVPDDSSPAEMEQAVLDRIRAEHERARLIDQVVAVQGE